MTEDEQMQAEFLYEIQERKRMDALEQQQEQRKEQDDEQ